MRVWVRLGMFTLSTVSSAVGLDAVPLWELPPVKLDTNVESDFGGCWGDEEMEARSLARFEGRGNYLSRGFVMDLDTRSTARDGCTHSPRML